MIFISDFQVSNFPANFRVKMELSSLLKFVDFLVRKLFPRLEELVTGFMGGLVSWFFNFDLANCREVSILVLSS